VFLPPEDADGAHWFGIGEGEIDRLAGALGMEGEAGDQPREFACPRDCRSPALLAGVCPLVSKRAKDEMWSVSSMDSFRMNMRSLQSSTMDEVELGATQSILGIRQHIE
jgi:hypothetical protein